VPDPGDNPPEKGLWAEYWRLGRPILVHGMLLLTLLSMFLAMYGVLRVFAAWGVRQDYTNFFDLIDFLGTGAVVVVISLDLVIKAILISLVHFRR
jgi:hypothetical protein